MLDLGRALRPYNPPRRRWMRRLNTVRRLARATRLGLLDAPEAEALTAVARLHHRRLRFAHGDLVVRNVLRHRDGLALIDWEWAGLYPAGYDEALLWFSLQDLEGGRARVEQAATVDEAAFLLSALVIELWHLQWYVGPEFRARHVATRDELVHRLLP
jgi:aminoglycoside phosphotransferase (APT) family kinase protein